RTGGQPHYLLVALAAAFLFALTPWGAYRAVQNSSNNLDAQLPATHAEIADLEWFREQFDGDQFVLVSWDGCTLAEAGRLSRVARRLAPNDNAAAQRNGADEALFTRVITGPEVLEQLMGAPYSLPYEIAVRRLEGAVIGPARRGVSGEGDQASRTTCLAAYLSPHASENEAARRKASEQIREVVAAEAHVAPNAIRMVGPGIDAVAINNESQQTLVVYGSLAAALGFIVSLWRLRSVALAATVTVVGVVSALATLAIVFYFGVFEVLAFNRVAPVLGRGDALVLGAAAVVYVLSIGAAIRLVYYYRDARVNRCGEASTDCAVRDGWPYWLLVPAVTAGVLGFLCLSDLLPARRFGLFAGLGLIASATVVLSIMSIVLHRFAPSERMIAAWTGDARRAGAPRWLNSFFECGVTAHLAVLAFAAAALGVAGWGLTKLDAAPRLPTLVGARSQLLQDYAWFDQRIGNAVPMEVIVTIPVERRRQPSEPAEADGLQYRLTLEERMALMQDLERQMAGLPEISAVLSPATAMPAAETLAGNAAGVREALERHGYVRMERHRGSDQTTGRELWRVSARVSAATPANGEVDYADIVFRVREAVNPVLAAYEQRDMLVAALHQTGQQLAGAKVAILFRAPKDEAQPIEGTAEALLAELLARSGVAGGNVTLVNLEALDEADRASQALRERTVADLKQHDAAIVSSSLSPTTDATGGDITAADDPLVEQMFAAGVNVVDVSQPVDIVETKVEPLVEAGGPRPIRAVYTGEPPVATMGGLELMATLRQSAVWVLPVLAVVMMFVAWDVVGGLLALVPIVLPTAVVLGALGWSGVQLDTGVLLLGALAIGAAIDGTVNFIGWFRLGADAELPRAAAARMAYSRMAPAMLDATLVGGIASMVFLLSGIASMQLFGFAAIGVLATSLFGTLILLPAMATSPLGRFFGAPYAGDEGIEDSAALGPAKTQAARDAEEAAESGRPDAAVVGGPAAPHRTRTGAPAAAERHEGVDGPHAALHERLQRLRRPAGDSPTS
ncbi:MAG TPA: MMPL family transporter, partial [Lacipirellula sp.]